MALKKSLYSNKGYAKHKNEGMSALANSLVSLADGEIDKITLANNENKIKLTITEKESNTDLFDMERDSFKSSLKGNTGILPYYISEYFGNKEVPRYLTKGEAAYAMTVNPELELLGVKNGKGGSTIISKETISLDNSEAYNNYKTFMTAKASDTPSIDKILSNFENFNEENYEEILINESGKIFDKMMEKRSIEEEQENIDDKNFSNPDSYFENNDNDEDNDNDETDVMVDNVVENLSKDNDKEIDVENEVVKDMAEVIEENLKEEERENGADTYENEVLNSIQ